MKRLTAPAPPTAPSNTFAAGWNTRCASKPFDKDKSREWKLGWQAANRVPEHGRRPFNDTVPCKQSSAGVGFADGAGFLVVEDVQRSAA